ncbi:MAG: glycosyltransferase family 2 protein, partial [Solirubrobacterales bacterium]
QIPSGTDYRTNVPEGREPRLWSVVGLVYNEVETLPEPCRRIDAATEGLAIEMVFSDNGSTDGTAEALEDLAGADPRVRALLLSRNFGHQASLTAALEHAGGDVVVMLDGDLQDPPELIPRMLEAWREGADVVYMVREHREGETRFKLSTARWFYKLLGKLTDIEVPQNAGDFRLLDRLALDALLAMPERNRFLRGMSAWIGFRQVPLTYTRDPRYAGDTKYSLRALVRFSLDAISSFSHTPLQLATLLGFTFSVVAFLAIPLAIGFRIAGEFVPGVTTVLLIVLLLGGIQLITVGIIGEYLGRVYDEVKARPLYVVRRRVNVAVPEGGSSEAPQGGTAAEHP